MSGARPMEIVASPELISVSNVFVLFHYLLWKAKLDFDCLEPKPRLVPGSLLALHSVRLLASWRRL